MFSPTTNQRVVSSSLTPPPVSVFLFLTSFCYQRTGVTSSNLQFSDRAGGGASEIDPLPDLGAAEAEEGPEVAEDAAVEGVLLVGHVLQVRDAVAGHELPRGAVHGGQVKVGAQQDQDDQGEDANHRQRPQEEHVQPEPALPGCNGGEARESDVRGPEQREQLDTEVQHEDSVVSFPDAVTDPGTVMIEATHAVTTGGTVPRSHRLQEEAVSTATETRHR